MRNQEIDHEHTDLIVCPYCGHENQDSWEIDFGPEMDAEMFLTCVSCENEFRVSCEVVVMYSTEKIKGDEQ